MKNVMMKKMTLFGLVVLGLIAVFGTLIFRRIEIFQPPKILFQGENRYLPAQIHPDLTCFRQEKAAKMPLPFSPLNRTFSLVSWNIHKGQDNGWQADLAKLADRADFLLLQEATDKQHLPPFSTALFVSAFAYRGAASGVATLSRFTPDFYCGGTAKEPWIRIPKTASAVNFQAENQGLLIINVHAVNFEWGLDAYQHQLQALLGLIEQYQGSVILAGDFNSWSAERLHLLRYMIQRHGFEEIAFRQDHRLRFFGYPLDHIFTRGVHVLRADTLALTSSDHNPMWLEFRLTPLP